jgi:CelD/BcsL family acetyltransferase involved in cellulose biosynthesis
MVESRGDKANFMSEQMGRFFHRMAPALAEEGLVRLCELELNGSAISSVLCFDQGKRLFLYNSGYDPAYAQFSVGLASKALVLQDAIESGHACVDFLRGHEPYKYDLGAVDRQIYKATIRR